MSIASYVLAFFLGCGTVFAVLQVFIPSALAEDKPKGPSCEIQLAESQVHAGLVARDREAKDQALAKEQVRSYLLQQRVDALEKKLTASEKKATEPKKESAEPKKE